ncbi:hypothetical protein [Carboxylicivirga marina]|uniref:Uncharacterized protein n=1 Tax=Carboxylicivirga marina TaxID=2800988 RepID=A0ABS1HP72_9BACT|nr:hypothetical protein [Carboxylicivirga marina]MBK3519483.1 hypothetical protein [Carboxylicivirga marina]
MNTRILILFILFLLLGQSESEAGSKVTNNRRFNIEKDLLLAHFDCKTDVDDLHSVAAMAIILRSETYSEINFHAVAGTYGIQEGLYVPPNDLFQLAFGKQWSDADSDFKKALNEVYAIVESTLNNGANVWIAEAGQSDFSAAHVNLIKKEMPQVDTGNRITIVQHSDWNEKVTAPESLLFVKEKTNYLKIEDGNAEGNGTPGFRTPGYNHWKDKLKDRNLIEIWQLAVDLGLQYNGKEGRYNNKAVETGGLDFSDISKVCYILNLEDIKDTEEFFMRFAQ